MTTDYRALVDKYRNKRPDVRSVNSGVFGSSHSEPEPTSSGGGIFSGIGSAIGGAIGVAGDAVGPIAGEVLTSLDRPRGALFGFLNDINQGLDAGFDAAGEGFKDPSKFRGTDILGIGNINDTDFLGDISLRDIAGFGAETFLDPTNIAIAGAGGALTRGIRGAGIRGVGAFTEPISGSSSFAKRFAAEGLVASSAGVGAQAGAELLPGEKYDIFAQLAGGLVGGGVANFAVNKTRLLNGADDPHVVNPYEDVYTVDFDDGPVELEGQIIRRSSVNDVDLNGNTQVNQARVNEARRELISRSGDKLGFNIDPEDEYIRSWIKSWEDNSGSSQIRSFMDQLSTGELSLSGEERLRQLYSYGDDVRNTIRKTDPFYNPAKDTTVLYRGENLFSLSEGGFFNRPLNDPQIVQPYTVDPNIAGSFAPIVGASRDIQGYADNFIISREIPVDDIITPTFNTQGEFELIVMDSRKLDDVVYERLTAGSNKSQFQKAAARDKPFQANQPTKGVRGRTAGFAEETPENIKELKPVPSEKAIAKANQAKKTFVTIRDEKGRIVSTQRVDADALDPNTTRALALRDDVRPIYERGSVTTETVGTPTPEAIEARRIERLNEQVASSRQSAEDEALRFFEQEDADIAARFNQRPIEGQAPERIQIPERTPETELPVPTQPRAYGPDSGATFIQGEAGTIPIRRRFNPERVRAAPEQIVEALESRRVQLNTLKKAQVLEIATEKGLPVRKSMTKNELINLIAIDEYKGEFAPLYAGVPEYTHTPSKVTDNISTDMPPLLEQRVASSYYNMVNSRELPPVMQEAYDKAVAAQREAPQDVLEKVNQSLKMSNASGDFSWSGIQGLQSISSWLVHGEFDKIKQFFSISGSALRDPAVINESINAANRRALEMGAPTLDILHSKGLSLQSLEGIEDIGRGLTSPVTSIPAVGGVIERLNKLFAIQGDYARIQNFYDAWARYGGPNLDDDGVQSLINSVNRMTGVSAKNRLGSHANMMLFAPRFIQSQIETVVHAFAFNNSIESRMARRGLGSLLGTGVAVTVMANELRAMGSEDYEPFTNTDFRLTVNGKPNSNFMRIKNVFGTDVSVFGPWDTLLRNALYIYDDPIQGSKEVLRSKSSPMLGLAWNIFSGRTFLGEPFDVTNPNLNMLEETFLPFALRDIGNEPLSGNIFGTFGVKATPLTKNEELTIKMRNAGVNPDDPLARRQWLVEHPEDKYKANTDEQELSDLVRGDIEQRNILNENRTITNQQTLPEFVENRRILQRELRNRLDTIFGEDFETRTPANEQERWIQEYFKLFDAAKNPITNDVNGTAFDLLLTNWVQQNGQAALKYVNEFNLVGNLQLENEYLSAISQLDELGYFDTPRLTNMRSGLDENTIMDLRQQVSTARLGNPRLAAIDYATAAWQVLREQGYSGVVVRDVVNAGKESYQSREFKQLKERYPHLIAWFNPNSTYSTLQQLQASGGATSSRRERLQQLVTR